MIFLYPLDALIPKIPFSFFPDFWVWVTSEARGSVSVGFWGSCHLSPFWGRGGSGRRALSTPPSPAETKTRPPQQHGEGMTLDQQDARITLYNPVEPRALQADTGTRAELEITLRTVKAA